MTPPRRSPRNIPKPKTRSAEWAEYASYTNIVKRWRELDAQSNQAKRLARYWQLTAIIGWLIALILVLLMIAR